MLRDHHPSEYVFGYPDLCALICAHPALEALEAVKKLGKPALLYGIDINNYPLEPHHEWYLDRAKGKSA